MSELPLWARALRSIDRAAWHVYQAHQVIRDELLFALLKPELRAALTVLAYSDMRSYLPGGTTFEEGLFAWERTLFAQPCIPRAGRVLLAAAGGGRELKALLEAGYAVTAFEPNPILVEGAAQVASQFSSAELFRAQYSDLSGAVRGIGPLASLQGQHFDWVLFGWGSFTHLTERSAQLAALSAVRALAPRAPLALSFYLRKPEVASARAVRFRRSLRGALGHLHAQGIDSGLAYSYIGGFVYSFTPEQIRELASSSAYRIEVEDALLFPHAVLLPT